MAEGHETIERGVPDLIDTNGLPGVLAAEIDFLAGRFEPWFACGPPAVRARAAAAAGDESHAAALLQSIDVDSLEEHELAAAAWAVSRVGSRPLAHALLAALAPKPPFLVVHDVPLGPRALAEGPLIAATGDLDGAIVRLEEAIAIGDARAPLWGALARVELARVMLCAEATFVAGSSTPGHSADQLLNAARLFFRAGGHRSLQARTDRVAHPEQGVPLLGGPTVGRLRPGSPWLVGFGVMGDVTLRSSKGLVAIRHLVANPGRPFPALALDRVANGGDADAVLAAADRLRGEDGRAGASTHDIRTMLFDDTVRSRVGKLLARTIERIAEVHPLLSDHLRATVRSGHLCRYDPPGGRSTVWVV